MRIALGIARHALDEITVQAVEKGRNFQPSPLSTHPHFQFAIGKAELELAAARALALQILSGIWDQARAGRIPPLEQQTEARRAAAYITELAERIKGTRHIDVKISANGRNQGDISPISQRVLAPDCSR